MKTYKLGTVGDRIVTVKKCAGGHVVTIRVKDDEKKSIELPPKRQVFFYFHAIIMLLWPNYTVFDNYSLILTLFVYVSRYRWAAFRQKIDDVSTSAKAVATGDEGVKLCQHIGGAHYVSVTSGYHCVDFRKWYQPYGTKDGDIKPTKRGVALRFDEWSDLCTLATTISTAYSSLASALPCYYDEDHMNPTDWLNCDECHPFINLSQLPTVKSM